MDDLTFLKAALAIAAGVAAGIINTLAGSGSAITLPILVYLGVPAHEANATNRIGVALQNIAAVATLHRKKALAPTRSDLVYTGVMTLGGVAGAAIAADVNEQEMNWAIMGMLVLVLATILLKPEQWLRTETDESAAGLPRWGRLPLFALIGAYGGFIQAGVGLFILAGLVLGANYALVHANKLKLLAVLSFTLAALAAFLLLGTRLWWGLGLILAVGQSVGAWLAASFMVENKRAKDWMRWLLILVIAYSILRFSPLSGFLSRLWPWAL